MTRLPGKMMREVVTDCGVDLYTVVDGEHVRDIVVIFGKPYILREDALSYSTLVARLTSNDPMIAELLCLMATLADKCLDNLDECMKKIGLKPVP